MAAKSRILILAQTPPPTHGQSVMVGHLVKAALERHPERFAHVNLRLSRDEQDVGTMRPSKLIHLGLRALQAVAACVFGGARDIYYVPAPAKKGPIVRDVLLLSLLRPFAKRLILHWHSVGLGAYLEENPDTFWNRRLRRLLSGHHLSLCLSQEAARDTVFLKPKRTVIVPNGIPDPCADFPALLAARKARLAGRKTEPAEGVPPEPVRLLYLGLCTRSKGIFEALSTAGALLQRMNANAAARSVILTIAGPFRSEDESREFQRELTALRAKLGAVPATADRLQVILPGFADSAAKRRLLEEADLFLFPTRYENEGLPLTILEAMAFGLPVLSTKWRAIPEIFGENYPFLCEIDELEMVPDLAAGALVEDNFQNLRDRFDTHFTLQRHLDVILCAILASK